MRRLAAFLLPLLCLLLPGISQAQQSKMFGPFELHYSVVNTTFLSPEVASAYGITRAAMRRGEAARYRETVRRRTRA